MECHIENDTLLIWFDENTFHDDLWENVNVYLDCCVAAVAFLRKSHLSHSTQMLHWRWDICLAEVRRSL